MTLSVHDTEHGPRAQVEIADEGPGISAELLPRLFERFVRGPGSRKGLGLGLYLAQRITREHGGELTVQSPPGRGARFQLRLPAQPAP